MKKFMDEFKTFAMKGNVLDMAVGVVIGGAFSKIVSALVENIIMPLLSIILGKINLATLSLTINAGGSGEIVLAYGAFLQTILDFLCIAFSLFLAVKLINKFQRKKEEAPKAEPKPTKEEELLTEIRDLLKAK